MHVEEGEREEDECDMGQGVEEKAQDTDFDEDTNTEQVCLLQHNHPTDPGLVQKYDIKSKQGYIKFAFKKGPCRPYMEFPKDERGRSSQKQWYSDNP